MTSPAAGSLAVLSSIASRLAEGGEIVATVEAVIGRLRDATDAVEASLWLNIGGTFRRSALAGNAVLAPEVVTAGMTSPNPPAGLHVHRLMAGGHGIGALALANPQFLSGDADKLCHIVANLLAPELAHAEDRHRLTGEVERSAMQVDAERRFTARIIDSLPLGLYVVDRDYCVQAWNRNRETGYQGVSREEAIGRPIFDVLHRQPAETLRAEFDDVFASGRIQQFNIESTASGAPRTYRITKIPMRLDDRDVTHVIAIGEDITEATVAQESWAQSEKLAAIGQLAAGVMHEINNPLATIAACAESLALRLNDLRNAGCAVPEQSTEMTRIIDQEVQRCKRIIDGLLTFARPQTVKRSPTDVNSVIQQTLFLIKHHVRFKQIRLQTLLAPDLEPVPANAEQLIQVFMALLINAADAIGDTGGITIRTRRGLSAADAVVAEVIDGGTGIPRSELTRIFEPFYTTKPPGRGTGLGLSVCYSIIASHDGRIEVDSAPGAGSTFRILLPAAPANPAEDVQ